MKNKYLTKLSYIARCRGFTLMETLVAMMILSISLTVIFELFSGGLRSAWVSADYTQAALRAAEKMEEVLTNKKLSDGSWSGDFDEDFNWLVKIRNLLPETEEKKPVVILYEITVTVSWADGNQRRHYQLNTLKIADQLTLETVL